MLLDLIVVVLTSFLGSVIIFPLELISILILYYFFGYKFFILLGFYLVFFVTFVRIYKNRFDTENYWRDLCMKEFDDLIYQRKKSIFNIIYKLSKILFYNVNFATNNYLSKNNYNDIISNIIGDVYIFFRSGILPTFDLFFLYLKNLIND